MERPGYVWSCETSNFPDQGFIEPRIWSVAAHMSAQAGFTANAYLEGWPVGVCSLVVHLGHPSNFPGHDFDSQPVTRGLSHTRPPDTFTNPLLGGGLDCLRDWYNK